MPNYDNAPDNLTRWQLVLKAAQELDKEVFTANDLVNKVQKGRPEVPATSIRTYVIAMAPNHPSYHHYPVHHPHFDFLGSGRYRLIRQNASAPIATPTLPQINAASPTSRENAKNDFLRKYNALLVSWAKAHKNDLIAGRKNYRWKDNSLAESLEKRNRLTKLIAQSRVRNNGGVDLTTLDEIMAWGFPRNPQFIPRDPNKCLETTREAFNLLDEGKPAEAICKLMSFPLIISRASKIVGLSDPNYFAIYDSRVVLALETLTDGDKRLIKYLAERHNPERFSQWTPAAI
jgi:hypothetical protein